MGWNHSSCAPLIVPAVVHVGPHRSNLGGCSDLSVFLARSERQKVVSVVSAPMYVAAARARTKRLLGVSRETTAEYCRLTSAGPGAIARRE